MASLLLLVLIAGMTLIEIRTAEHGEYEAVQILRAMFVPDVEAMIKTNREHHVVIGALIHFDFRDAQRSNLNWVSACNQSSQARPSSRPCLSQML